MYSVRVKKSDVEKTVIKNLASYPKRYEQELAEWRAEAIKQCKDTIKALKAGSTDKVRLVLPPPVDRTDDYKRALQMLQMAVGDEFELSGSDFKKFVQNDWEDEW